MKRIINILNIALLLLSGVVDSAMSQTVNIRGNVYGGGEVARVEGSTTVTVTDVSVPDEYLADTLLSSPRYSVFGGGLGKTATVTGNTSVDVSLTKKGNSLFEVIGGGMNGSVGGTCNVHIGGVVGSSIYNVYGGGYYATVGNTSLVITGGNITNDVYGGGVMGSIVGTGANDGTASTKIGLLSTDPDYSTYENNIQIAGNVYGGNDVGGSVGTAQMVINGGTIVHDVYGAGNGNHPGYTNPEYVEYKDSEHKDATYTEVQGGNVYQYRPRTTNVNLTIAGNEGTDFFDATTVDKVRIDKVRILGRTFGGGNSCNVGEWNDDGNFTGGGSIYMTIGNHVQLGVLDEPHDDPTGLFMGSNGKSLVEQPDGADSEMAKYYHWYLDTDYTYKFGFAPTGDEKSFKTFAENILTWTDDVHLSIADGDDDTDIWMSNFVGGGFRGSMKAKTSEGKFHYSLPEGLTVAHTIVGGAFNAHIDYTKAGSTTPTYSFKGGVLAADDDDRAARIHRVHADPRAVDVDSTAYFMPLQEGAENAEADTIREKLYYANKEKAFVYLDLKCALHPVGIKGGGDVHSVYGGTVYGGCFESGNIEGDTWVNYGCYLSPLCERDPLYDVFFNKKNNLGIYGEVADLERNNALNVFGAGYGVGTRSMGDVYLCVQSIASQATGDEDPSANFPYIFNAFGGSNMGTVAGNVNVYFDSGVQGTLLGSLYGGGYKGRIDGNTFVELASGFLVNVYGGSRQADIGGASHVWAYDGLYRGAPTANHLIICNLYGGNDIAGIVEGTMPAAFTASKWNKQHGFKAGTIDPKMKFNSYVEVSSDDDNVNRGFPLIGRVFAGGNGENWEAKYGDKPEIANALIDIAGGTTLQAFGGGNKATITEGTYIFANAATDKFADVTFSGYQKNIMQKVFFSGVPTGYKWDGNRLVMNPYHVVRMFGGNNLATMDIQPTWNLVSGRIENVYSGGNEGDMTYYNPKGEAAGGAVNAADSTNANYNPRGLSITIDQPNIHIGSLFGGCRISDVKPTPKAGQSAWPTGDDGEDYYGATVNVLDGYIENIYGGNDISGKVYHGTNVNLSGAVSGNVYGSGNGHYLYKYNPDATGLREQVERNSEGIAEYLYYDIPGVEGASDTKKLLTINSKRPSVEKTLINISGNEDRVSYVKGNVYCGGNATTVEGPNSFTKFKIGDYVTLNGVFMGCDGAAYAENEEIAKFAEINGIKDMGAATELDAFKEFASDDAAALDDHSRNPILLNVYMKAVDMKALPKGFNLDSLLTETYIGTFCAGGNRGSMTTDETVSLTFHNSLFIYDKIVAGCMNANVRYNQEGTEIVSNGGFTRAIADTATYGNTKIDLTVASQFIPVTMDVPAAKKDSLNSHGEDFDKAKAHNFLYSNFSEGEIWEFGDFNERYKANWQSQEQFEEFVDPNLLYKVAPNIYTTCNVYGGCYDSGDIVGGVNIKLHSNMLRYANQDKLERTNNNAYSIACFNVYGGGFGQDSHVWGNVNITMDRCQDPNIMSDVILQDSVRKQIADSISEFDIQMYNSNLYDSHFSSYPSANNIFGGGRNGQLIGNSAIEVRNGRVYEDVVGGCYASNMYGSTQIVVGYPKYYQCNTSGEYALERGDQWNNDKVDMDGNPVIKQSVKYLKGDLVPDNVYKQITDTDKSGKFAEHCPAPANWDDIYIEIGKGVFGGGYSHANSAAASAGAISTFKLTDGYIDGNPLNFNERYGYGTTNTVGYGGNSSIMIGDDVNGKRDHIHISKLIVKEVPEAGKVGSAMGKFIKESDGRYTHLGDVPYETDIAYYDLSGDGGVYGDGHMTFCEGFRTADITGYGYAEGTAKHPVLLNTFQRMDLLSLNDCCIMLQGAQDFATDQIDATTYCFTRINELRMNSTINANAALGQISSQDDVLGVGCDFDSIRQRNYMAFFNNIHYLGSIVTNDAFDTSAFHGADGSLESNNYMAKKTEFIDAYKGSDKKTDAINEFKKRNVGTARNAIGINNGFSLRIQNLEYVDGKSKTYYGPIVGVCEAKLLTLTEGEGGGYIYADNIHKDEDDFLNTSGNFVFPGIVKSESSQFIVDDCFATHFGTKEDFTTKAVTELDEAHYWYVEGNRYFFNTTLTGYTYKDPLSFDLTKNDPNILLSGMENGSELKVKKIEWLSTHRDGYDCVLENSTPNKTDDYEFDIQIAGSDWTDDMPRYTADAGPDKIFNSEKLPQFNIHLQDKLDNSGRANYENHLDEPELVKIYLTGKASDGLDYDYTITLKIIYLQGPSFIGGVNIENCALPGERIGFSTDGIMIVTSDLMAVTKSEWKIVPLKSINDDGEMEWDIDNGVVIPESMYKKNDNGALIGSIPAYYKQNEHNIAFVFTAGGIDFPVLPVQRELYSGVEEYNAYTHNTLTKDEFDALTIEAKTKSIPEKENRMIVVHNYHRMKDVVSKGLQIEKLPEGDPRNMAEAKLYIEDEEDLKAFFEYLNISGTDNIPAGLAGFDFILQKNVVLSEALPTMSQKFAGTFHGDGYHIDLGNYGTSLFGGNLDSNGKVYNLGVIHGTVASTGTVVNSYELKDSEDFNNSEVLYGAKAYELSHNFKPEAIYNADGYVEQYYANGDYQYATTNRAWSLRTGAPNYGNTASHHDVRHSHDEVRWNETKGVNIPLYDGTMTLADSKLDAVAGSDVVYTKGITEGYANDYLFFGQHLDKENADAYPMHINQVATGDADEDKGGNRVYQTAGYYQSKADQKFHYNKDAWALNPALTAIDYTSMTAEGDGAVTSPTKFSVDSNKDGAPTYSNKTTGHVTQNLLVYNAGESVFDKKDVNNIAEKDVVYHNIVKKADKFSTNYFHLVDKQDFNAPVAFNVNTRAWYERMPQSYRSGSALAWEGICIPFTAKKVYAMVENPEGGADIASEISHFYGRDRDCAPEDNDHTLHHEYWLNGMVADGTTGVAFARPSTDGAGLFTDASQEKGNYVFQNNYFVTLPNYDGYYGTRDDEEWYAKSHTFEDYVYLSRSVPYVVAFPGEDYYEFDLTGNSVIFESGETAIAVSDSESRTTTVGSCSHRGAYLHEDVAYQIDNEGNSFESGSGTVLPFRTYLETSAPAAPFRIAIAGAQEAIEETEPEDPVTQLEIYVKGNMVFVSSPYERDLHLPVYMSSGHLVTVHKVTPGLSSFRLGHAGVYVIGENKILVK